SQDRGNLPRVSILSRRDLASRPITQDSSGELITLVIPMLHSLTLIAALFIGSCAYDETALSLAISNDPYGAVGEYESSAASSPLYERPSGPCTASGGMLLYCHCQGGENAVGGISGGKVVAFVCAPSCGRRTLREAGDSIRMLGGKGGSCPASALGRTECRSGMCFVVPNPGCPSGMYAYKVGYFGVICMYNK
ncbi:hypothetical protein Pmar_PMAR027656, partial [Perkinsus marinus ATCC 50983]